MKILILDDLPIRHETFKSLLKNHEVTHVWTFDDAVEQFTKNKFDMACLDHDLGDFISWKIDMSTAPAGIKEINGNKIIIDSRNFKLSFSPSFIPTMYGSSSGRALDGTDLAHWLKNNPSFCPPRVLIHSWNMVGSQAMEVLLKQIPGVFVTRKEFSTKNPWR